jgi:hypothetical protein
MRQPNPHATRLPVGAQGGTQPLLAIGSWIASKLAPTKHHSEVQP